MTTIDITEHLAQFTACGVIVVDGERHYHDGNTSGAYLVGRGWQCATDGCDAPYHHEPGEGEYGLIAPELWRKLTEPCGFCRDGCDVYECCVTRGGGGVVSWDYLCDRHFDHQGFHDCNPGCCEHCMGGRQVITLTATCPMCLGVGQEPAVDILSGDVGHVHCLNCTEGVVTLGRFLVAVRVLDDGRFEIGFEEVAP